MNATSEDIKDLLVVESSLGLVYPTNIGIAREESKPDNWVTLFDYGTGPPMLTLDQVTGYNYEYLQIRVRNIDYTIGWALADEIKSFLHGQANVEINGTLYTLIRCTSGPALLDWDKNNRSRIIINFEIQRKD